MKFKFIFLSAALLICTVQLGAQVAEPVMPVDQAQELKTDMSSNLTMPTPESMPDANPIPVMPATSNIIPEQRPTTPPLGQITATNPPAQPQALPVQVDTKKNSETPTPKTNKDKSQKKHTPRVGTLKNSELDFEVENQTGKTIYVACFSYIKKRPFSRWHWNKSPAYKIEDNKNVIIDIPTISDEEDRNNTFGYLGVFETEQDAEASTLELLDDSKKIDLDIIAQLHGKKVTIEIEKYGIAGEFYDFDFQDIDKKKDVNPQHELDFYVENRTGKTVFITCFVYEKKAKGNWLAKKTKEAWTSEEETRDDMSLWRFDKTSVIKIKPNEQGFIDVDTIIEPRDRIYVRGYLAIFDEDEQDLAEKSVYELTHSKNRLDLGKLIELKHKKIIIYTERYGAVGNIIDYVVKPTQKPNIQKIITGYLK